MAHVELPVEGMTCEHCVRTLTAALEAAPGVEAAAVSLEMQRAAVEFDANRIDRSGLVQVVEKAGYHVSGESSEAVTLRELPKGERPVPAGHAEPPVVHEIALPRHAEAVEVAPHPPPGGAEVDAASVPEASRPSARPPREHTERLLLDLEGMHCASCVGRIEQSLARVEGVKSARANLATEQASVVFDSRVAGVDDLLEAVHAAGYGAEPAATTYDDSSSRHRGAREAAAWRARFYLSLLLLAPMVATMHLALLEPAARGLLQVFLASVMQFGVGWPYLVGAARQLRRLSSNMDTLVALGTGVAYTAGVWGWWTGTSMMFLQDAGMILCFITLGKLLEAKAKGRASAAIRRLLDLTPPVATVLRHGRSEELPLGEVNVGDLIVVRPGERVPLDAVISSGRSSLDESWLTGESLPIEKSPGEEILAGTLNGSGALTARVTRAAGQTTLAQVVELVRHAQESKPAVQRLADRVVAVFVPAVLTLAFVTMLAWGLATGDWVHGLPYAVAVLVAACPCALGLATPTAVLVGSGRGAEHGILIKDAQALEVAGRLTTVVLDKTGTVTEGRPRVTQLAPADGIDDQRLLATAAAAERLSQHPLAECIVAEAERRAIPIPAADALEVVEGAGVRAQVGSHKVVVGNERLFAAEGISLDAIQPDIAACRSAGATALLVGEDGTLLGLVAVADAIAPHAQEAVERLKASGLKLVLLTGDHRSTAEAVAGQLAIDTIHAEVLPADKQRVVAELREAGEVVAMVGDGINDAPALTSADLGIAIGSGSDVAIESADMVLVASDLRSVSWAIALSRATLRTIRENLIWAFFYNVLLLPLAAGVLVPAWGIRVPPAAAAAAMAASSVSVVLNSLRLRIRRLE